MYQSGQCGLCVCVWIISTLDISCKIRQSKRINFIIKFLKIISFAHRTMFNWTVCPVDTLGIQVVFASIYQISYDTTIGPIAH